MGISALWKYINNHNIERHLGKGSDKLMVNHLLIDMNSIMHCCFESSNPTIAATIVNVLEKLRTIITNNPPNSTLTLVFDGVAPVAKIATQRERRRNQLNNPRGKKDIPELCQAQIVTGSFFVAACEAAVIELMEMLLVKNTISPSKPVYISSYQSPGEGETKISRRLQSIYEEQVKEGTYNGEDIFLVVGGDSDLILTCIGSTPFHNFFLMSPHTHLLIDIGELFNHWLQSSGDTSAAIDLLPSFRVDFILLMNMAGGDFYDGLGDKAIELWRRYRHLRLEGGLYRSSLITNNSFDLNYDVFMAIFAKDQKRVTMNIKGSAFQKAKAKAAMNDFSGQNSRAGAELISRALWSLATTIEGQCPCPEIQFSSNSPKPCSVKAAVFGARGGIRVPRSSTPYTPLPPISVYLGAIGRHDLMPPPFDSIFRQESHKSFPNYTATSTIMRHIDESIIEANTVYSEAIERDPKLKDILTLRPDHEFITVKLDNTIKREVVSLKTDITSSFLRYIPSIERLQIGSRVYTRKRTKQSSVNNEKEENTN
eukprot:Tbor_TRINITY_DN4605_c0_g1::TRINITY_DN4605_c0_g1_i1::g.14836::m.14836